MKYERIMKTSEIEEILNEFKTENIREIQSITNLINSINFNKGYNLLIKHLDYYCKDKVIDLIQVNNIKNLKEIDYRKKVIFQCFELSTPRFYESYINLKTTVNDKEKTEEKIIKECMILENSKFEIKNCILNKLRQYKKLLSYEIDVYNSDIEDFKSTIYL